MIAEERGRIAEVLRRRSVVKSGNFSLHLGRSSEYYVDLRALPSYPDDFDYVAAALARAISREVGAFDRIVGVGDGAAPLTVAVSLKLQKPYAIIRKMEADNSFRDPFLGNVSRGERAILLDDVASTGLTLACAAAMVRAVGGSADVAVVLVDRELGAEELLRSMGVRLISMLKLSEILPPGPAGP